MLLERRKDDPHARCPFCHDGLEAARLVECDACRALYHAECVERCVVLACAGRLVPKGLPAPPRAVVRLLPGDLHEAPRPAPPAAAPPRSPRVAALCRLGFLVSFAGFVGLLAVGAALEAHALILPAFLCLVLCVAFAQGETSPSTPEREAERQRQLDARAARARPYVRPTRSAGPPPLTPVEPAPDAPLSRDPPLPPGPAAFPAMFGAPPAVEGGGAALDDEALRRISARREARRPGGLGKTL